MTAFTLLRAVFFMYNIFMNVSEAIRLKRAVRNFTSEPLPEEVVHAILNAGRRSQSSKNSQPWHFIAIRDKTILQTLSECGTWAGHLAGAALGVAILTPDPAEKFQTMFDAGQAGAYMQLAAWELGVGSCPASIYEPDKARQLLRFPPELHLRIALSFGYPADDSVLTAAPVKGGRRVFDETVHWEKW
jgi:nitroreductase